MTMNDEQQLRSDREHRQVKALKQRVIFLELQLSIETETRAMMESLLFECVANKYVDADKCSARWLEETTKAIAR
jgi:hypothetical protein